MVDANGTCIRPVRKVRSMLKKAEKTRWLSLVACLVAGALTLAGGAASAAGPEAGTGPSVPAATRPTALLSPAQGALFGAYVEPTSGWGATAVESDIVKVETDLGRKFDIDHHFFPFGVSFPGKVVTWDVANGRIPMISWGGTYTDQILNGSQDALIRTRANAIKALNGDVFLRFFPEMDGTFHSNWTGTPSKFVASWRRVHDIFTAQGVTNVAWVWCPTSWGFTRGAAPSYYPGDAYTDWVCADAYDWYPGRAGSKWMEYGALLSAFYAFAQSTGKPAMTAEVGVQEDPAIPGRKATWIGNVQTTLKTQFPDIQAFVYFEAFSKYNWRTNTSTSARAAWKAMGVDPYFVHGSIPPSPPATVSGPLVPDEGALFGAYVQPTGGWSAAAVERSIEQREAQIGRKLDIDQHFFPFESGFPGKVVEWDIANGRIPMISWAGTYLDKLLNGSHDALIRARADGLKALDARVFLRFYPEMNGAFHDAWTGRDYTKFIAAWRHVHDIFVARGASNVVWAWTPTSIGPASLHWYPGGKYVDWIGMDPYNWYPGRPHAGWREFGNMLKPLQDAAVSLGKPALIGETGVQEDPASPGRKAEWLGGVPAAMAKFPAIKALVYFDSFNKYNWKASTSSTSLSAYSAMANASYFTSH
jgi:beta-mannanase